MNDESTGPVPASEQLLSWDPNQPRPQPEVQAEKNWKSVLRRSKVGARIAIILFLTAMVAAAVFGYRYFTGKAKPAGLTIQSQDLQSLPNATLGHEGQTLTVAADSTFKGKLTVGGDINVVGKINAANPLEVSALTVAGATTLSTADIKSNLNVAGSSALQGNVSVASLLSVGKDLNVTGNGSFGGSLTGGNLTVKNTTVAGSLTLGGHVISGGGTPGVSAGAAAGGAGSASINGNDRAGTVTVNTGSGAGAGGLVTVSFRASYGGLPHVLITPLGPSAAGLQYYVTKSTGGFTIGSAGAAPSGSSFSFDYLVEQ